MASRGAVIAAVDINPLGLDETVAAILAAGGRVKDYLFDTAKRLPVVALVDEVLDDWGRIDILILAAEVHPSDPILTMDEWDFHRTLDVNLAGPFFLMQRVAQAMKNQGGGVIVVVAERGACPRVAGRSAVRVDPLHAHRTRALPTSPARPPWPPSPRPRRRSSRRIISR